MMALTQDTEACRALALGFLQRRNPIEWLEWLPLAQIAAEAPAAWVGAFDRLSLEQQFTLLELLRQPASGPLADSLAILLATYVGEIGDEQVRQYALDDAQAAHERQDARLRELQNRWQPLIAQEEQARQRLQQGFDMAVEIQRLEAVLADLRRQENDQDERFARVHELERDCLRLETHRRILAHYDEDERRRHLDGLRAEVNARQERKAELEQAIAVAMGERDGRQREVEGLQRQLDAIARELETGRSQWLQLQQDMSRGADELARQQELSRRLGQEREQLRSQTTQLEQQVRALQTSLQAERDRLRELQASSQRAGMAELERKVREVYALLPDDLADRAMPPTGSRTGS